MPEGKVTEWNGRTGRIESGGTHLFFGDRSLLGWAAELVWVGARVQFVEEFNRKKNRNEVKDVRPLDRNLPRSTQFLIEKIPDNEQHPGLRLDKYLIPPPKQEQQREVLQAVAQITGDGALLRELRDRRRPLWERDSENVRIWERTTCTPLTLHLSRTSSLENAGLCLHPIYGFAYLPGTGLKGLARAYAETVENADAELVRAVFGNEPGEPAKEKQCAGSIIFHDAWPTQWPRLFVDIVNNHHPKYYEGKDAPGDWDAPNPVTFLAIKPETTFEFTLAKRRTDVSQEILENAQKWLNGALTHLGCGAKTAAGYGYFKATDEVEAAPPSSRPIVDVTVALSTPGFLGGADHEGNSGREGCDLRSATLRGLLRKWWRTLHSGFLKNKQLLALESAIWGDTKSGGAVWLRVEKKECPEAQLFAYKDGFDAKPEFKRAHGLADRPDRKTTQGLFYLSYGMDDGPRHNKRQRFYLDSGAKWNVRLMARPTTFLENRDDAKDPKKKSNGIEIPAEDVLDQAQAALWLLTHFGGAGSKARKGFGSLHTVEGLQEWDLERVKTVATALRKDRLNMAPKWNSALAETGSLFDEKFKAIEVATDLVDPWQALDHLGFVYQRFAQHQQYKHNEAKISLGLPRKIHGPRNEPMQGQNEENWKRPQPLRLPGKGAGSDRHASPVQLHLEPGEGEKLIVRVCAFPAPYLPDRASSIRILHQFLDHLEKGLEGDGPTPVQNTGPGKREQTTKRDYGTSTQVRLLAKRKKSGFDVQEEGYSQGTLTLGSPPEGIPLDIGVVVKVEVHNDDPNKPQYRWPAS